MGAWVVVGSWDICGFRVEMVGNQQQIIGSAIDMTLDRISQRWKACVEGAGIAPWLPVFGAPKNLWVLCGNGWEPTTNPDGSCTTPTPSHIPIATNGGVAGLHR
jgi:hypothetical protein